MTTIDATMSAHALSWKRPRRRVEMLNASSGLNGRARQGAKAHMVNCPAFEQKIACHSETRGTPELVENRVSATFAAQVLGQGQRAERMDASNRAQAYARANGSARAPQLLRLA